MANISYRRLQGIYFCQRYREFREKLHDLEFTIHSADMNSDRGRGVSNSIVEAAAMKAVKYRQKIYIIENAVRTIEGVGVMYEYMLRAVTDEFETYGHLQMQGLPLSRNAFYAHKNKIIDCVMNALDYN